ncbi:MAG: DUF1365 domain-containing protein, partial [Nitriliruptoraceae bacterium]
DPLASAVFVGSVRHRRHVPRPHAFRYRTHHVLLDLDELDVLDRAHWWFGARRRAVTSFHDRDHLDGSDRDVRDQLTGLVVEAGRAVPTGPLRVLTNLRVLGHVFNPVSWWFWYDDENQLALVVAEVHNTFGDRWCHLLGDLDVQGTLVRARSAKVLHVSPFLPVEGLHYAFTFRLDTDERMLAHIDVVDADGQRVLDATQTGRRRPFAATGRLLLTQPLAPLRTVALIHLQAVRLWWRRTTFHRRPQPPPGAIRTRQDRRR